MNIPIAVFDFESYYDPVFSLSKITTEEYIRSDLFETIGCSIQMPTWARPQWFVGKDVGFFIAAHKDELEQCAFLAHNCAFDGAIAAWRYGLHAKIYLDTMGMAQPLFGFTTGVSLAKLLEVLKLGQKGDEVVHALGKRLHMFSPQELARYGEYCINDNIGCRKIFEYLLPLTPRKELMAIDEELKCFIDPRIHLDQQILAEYHQEIVDIKQSNLIWAGNALDLEPDQVQTAIMSNDKLAVLLQELDVDPPTKVSPTTGKSAWAFAKTDEEFLALKEHDDPRVQVLVECRLGGKSTIAETRSLRLLDAAKRGPLPVMLKHYAAHTGRLGGGDAINMQNLMRHVYDETGTLTKRSKLRDAICAPPDHELVGGDLSQIEARVLAHLAGQDDVVDAFARYDADPKNNPDIYCVTAELLLGRVITKKDNPKERQLGKTCRLALGYGMGVDRFIVTAKKDRVPLARPLAESLHKRFRDVSPMIVKFWKDADRALSHLLKGEEFAFGRDGCIVVKADGIHLPSGRVLRYPGLEQERGEYGMQYTYLNRKKRKKIYGAKLVENICQSIAGSVVGDAWLRLRGKLKVVMQVHDELVACVHKTQVEWGVATMRWALTQPVPWLPGLPVACDVSHAYRYGDVK
jgi:DNA polymerase